MGHPRQVNPSETDPHSGRASPHDHLRPARDPLAHESAAGRGNCCAEAEAPTSDVDMPHEVWHHLIDVLAEMVNGCGTARFLDGVQSATFL